MASPACLARRPATCVPGSGAISRPRRSGSTSQRRRVETPRRGIPGEGATARSLAALRLSLRAAPSRQSARAAAGLRATAGTGRYRSPLARGSPETRRPSVSSGSEAASPSSRSTPPRSSTPTAGRAPLEGPACILEIYTPTSYRGGTWANGLNAVAVGYRQSQDPDEWGTQLGFRCVRAGAP